ncbi:protein Swt21p [Monosporozyma unispora]|nr:Swt21p [Kazachstania unispora]
MNHSSLRVSHSTLSTFQQVDVDEVWKQEDSQWRSVQDKFPDYQFPKLEHSLYEKCKEVINKPVVIQDIKWSRDGTSITTVSNDTGIRQYLIPEENTQENIVNDVTTGSKLLTPFIRKFKNRSIVCSETHPLNSMYDEKYNFVLLSSRDMPIQMYDLSPQETGSSSIRFSYEIMNPLNEKLEVPYSIKIFPNQNETFYTGGNGNKIKVYDMSRSFCVNEYYSRRGKGSKSIISCFDDRSTNYVMNDKVLIWANYKNEVGQLDIRCAPNDTRAMRSRYTIPRASGDGIYQMLRSDNDHYLYVLLRKSNKIQIFDHRGTLDPINSLTLPFKIGYQKQKAIIDEDQGFLLGSDKGTLLTWDKSLIEAGGVCKSGSNDNENSEYSTITLKGMFNVQGNNTRIHLVSRNPNHGSSIHSYAAATSSDRNYNRSISSSSTPHCSLFISTPMDSS